MRIGRIMIDTDNMTVEELKVLERKFRAIRCRKELAEDFASKLNTLVAEAKEAGFTFVDKDFGQVIMGNDFMVYDEKPED